MRRRVATAYASLAYFGIVFGVGFVLGVMRTLWLVPAVGHRVAELIEAPLMLGVIVLAARFIATRCASRELIAVGFMSACLVIGLDIIVGVALRQMSIREIFMDRDIVTGTVYYLLIGAFAVAPYLMSKLKHQE